MLSLHDDSPSSPSDEFQFESEYVRSLLKQRTPSPAIVKPALNSAATTTAKGKENFDRWKTPVTIGAHVGRSVLAERDMNSGFGRSASVMGSTEEATPGAVKFTSSYDLLV